MKFLKNETAYRRWARKTFVRYRGRYATALINEHAPEDYPCFAAMLFNETDMKNGHL